MFDNQVSGQSSKQQIEFGNTSQSLSKAAVLDCQRRDAVLDAKVGSKILPLLPKAYEMVLTAFLMSPAHHGALLPLLRRWPTSVYSVPALTDAVLQR